jgi:hypothetical protein
MNLLDIYTNISEQPDGYWILNDLCLQNNWAFVDYVLPCWIAYTRFDYQGSYSRHITASRSNWYYRSYAGGQFASLRPIYS